MVQVLYITKDRMDTIDVDFGMNPIYEKTVNHILKGEVTIVGAYPDKNLIIVGNKIQQTSGYNNTNPFLDDFNKDEVKGDVVVMKTNDIGEPINIDHSLK